MGDAARALPLGVFREDSPTEWGKCHEVTKGDGPRQGYPPKWSFASFSSNKKRKSRGVLGARLERPLSPGPARSDRSKALKRQVSYSVKLKASNIPAPPGLGKSF